MMAIDIMEMRGFDSHSTLLSPRPDSMRLSRPVSNPKSCCHRMVTTTPEMTTGIKKEARKKPRMAIFSFRM